MKILRTSDITDINSMPLKSGSLQFIQEAYRETNSALVQQIIGHFPDPNKGYITDGVVVTIVGANYTISSGHLYWQGEIFPVLASSFTLLGGEQVFADIIEVAYPAADPVLFGDNVERNVHLDRNLRFGSSASGDLLLDNTIIAGSWLNGDIKEIDCTNAYITANFDGTGLGINERQGWAICNGNNGTKNRTGRVSLAYGVGYSTMGAIGGSKDAVVVSHSHTYNETVAAGSAGVLGFDSVGDKEGANYSTVSTSTTGVSGTDQNLQPYIVTLFIQKL